jgi:hypothetical protein
MWQSSPKYLWFALAWLAATPTASAAASSPPKDEMLFAVPLRVDAARDVFQSVACNEQTSSLSTLKQKFAKILAKVAANGHRPMRLSRLRAHSAVSVCGAFLQPDTLQIQDVRLEI